MHSTCIKISAIVYCKKIQYIDKMQNLLVLVLVYIDKMQNLLVLVLAYIDKMQNLLVLILQ